MPKIEQRGFGQACSVVTNARFLWLVTVLTTVGFAGCSGSSTTMMESAAPFPTSIQYDKRRDRLLVSSYSDGSVTEVGMDPSQNSRVLLTPHHDGIERGIRIRIDSKRDRLWLLARGELYVYQFETNQL